MNPFILTGAPGAGKTVVLRQLEVMGHAVVEEAATDVIALAQAKGIAEPHLDPGFIDAIVTLQERRRRRSASPAVGVGEGDPEEKRISSAPLTFHDRSPICTLALAQYLAFPVSEALAQALGDIEVDRFYARRVFFLRNLGFIVNTDARQISFEDTLRFEQVHEAVYRRLGYDLVFIDAAGVETRARRIIELAEA